MQMMEPITGKVVKMPDQCVPMPAANCVITTVNPAPAAMRTGRPHQTCSRSSSEGGARGVNKTTPRNARRGNISSQRWALCRATATKARLVQIAKLMRMHQNQCVMTESWMMCCW